MKVAIVHEWLVNYAGSEKVLAEMIGLYPEADIFSIIDFLSDREKRLLLNKGIKTSFIQHLPMAKAGYRNYLPIMPIAIKRFDLSRYDLVISSSHAIAKGIKKDPEQLHICYCHTPMRYIWDLQSEYLNDKMLGSGPKGIMVRTLLNYLRKWDTSTSKDVDYFISNSYYIRERIKRIYKRDAEVIYPPVDIASFKISDKRDTFFITVSRMVPYKRVDLIVRAFAMTGLPLIVVGDGPELRKIKRLARRNIEFMGFLRDDILRIYLQRARAFVYAAEEDFGIAPVEAQACGIPVIAFGKGGVRETVVPFNKSDDTTLLKVAPTGVFFYQQTPDALNDAIKRFMDIEDRFNPYEIRKNAERFSRERFRREFKDFVDKKIEEFFNP